MRRISISILAPVILLFCSCVSQKFTETDLYFGLSKNDGTIISDSAWNAFVQVNVAPTFYKGFTIVKTEGRWLDEKSGKIYKEPSHIIVSINKMNHSFHNI